VIEVHVHGAGGRMGRTVVAAVEAAPDLVLSGTSGRDDDLGATLDERRPDVLVEFTVPAAAAGHLRAALERGVPTVSGTTGLPGDVRIELDALARRQNTGLLLAPNFAVGVVLMQRFAREAVRHLRDVEIIEFHHDGKVDAPSGTALRTAEELGAVREGSRAADAHPARGQVVAGVPVHSVRLPGLLAHQEILFGGPGQLLTLRHDTLDRAAFMPGVLLGVRSIRDHVGLVDSLEPLLGLDG